MRGQSDSFALRLAHHDETVNAQMMPRESEARASFLPRRRTVRSTCARDMKGIARNLADMHEARCIKQGYHDKMTRERAGFRSTGIYGAEALTGAAPPPAAEGVVAAWQSWITERVGDKLDNLASLVDDQQGLQM